jgi:hypothetical protein
MNAAEQLIYILRLAVICMSAVIIVIILGLTSLNVGPTAHYHVDSHISTMLYSGDFWMQPGVINVEKFTNESLPSYTESADDTPFYVDMTLGYDDVQQQIVMHPRTKERLEPLKEIRGIQKEIYTMPVTVDTKTSGILLLEVYFEIQ